MKTILLALLLALAACSKDSNKRDQCETWNVLYFQGTANKTTVTTNYSPHFEDEEYCGTELEGVEREKIVIISQVSADLFNYRKYVSKR